ncbi:MAG: 3-deoxy-7-phosphoheptulonate synthase [Pseudomonadales bacterium]|jgi:3-deoxy-7-phosphoheptulonate synthase|nr:3-deoxy-7-phosphoheptulonate synthase [Pseudomonadales bacterium]
MSSLDDLRIRHVHPLVSPAVLGEELPIEDAEVASVGAARDTVRRIVRGEDPRLLVVVGPCSIHDVDAALEYAERLRALADEVSDALYVVMRVYFEKPRTVVGWKGLINDPQLDGSFRINDGLRRARRLLLAVNRLGLPAATEFLDTTFGQFYADLVSWAAIGARTTESQIHRQLASGLSMPVGFKNRTDGDVQVAVDAIRAAASSHLFPSLTKEGAPAIFETRGNPDGHLVLRGGAGGPNHDAAACAQAVALLEAGDVEPAIVIDASNGNSGKDPLRQPAVVRDVVARRRAGDRTLRGVMLESNLVEGRQDSDGRGLEGLVRGQSITDACLGFEATAALLREIARA